MNDTVPFHGFPPEALDFYEGLEADNTKTFWTEHKATYETAVRQPLLALCAHVEPEFGSAKVFRPYRDVRFSKDKSPYKTAQGAVLWGPDGSDVLYVQISAAGLLVGAGYYEMASDQVQRYRDAVDDETTGEQLRVVIETVESAGHLIEGQQLKTRPRGVAADHPRLDLLRYRSLIASRAWPPLPWLHTDEVSDILAKAWREMAPLNTWLARHVGPTQLERR